jgi:hypothetical protein
MLNDLGLPVIALPGAGRPGFGGGVVMPIWEGTAMCDQHTHQRALMPLTFYDARVVSTRDFPFPYLL